MLGSVPDLPYNTLHFLFHLGTEFLQAAEVLNRLREADRLVNSQAAEPGAVRREPFDESLRVLHDQLRTPEDLAAALSPKEIRALRDAWEIEVRDLIAIMWAKYADTFWLRIKRRMARRYLAADADHRVEARKTRAATKMGLAGPGSIDKLLTSKKAQGGVYDIDPRLLRYTDGGDPLAYVVPAIPVSKASRKKR